MPRLFVNYVRDPVREVPLNLAVSRVILGGYLIWKTVWYDWGMRLEVPFDGSTHHAWAVPNEFPALLVVEKWVLLGTLLMFVVGYRLGAATYLSALLLAHLGTVRLVVNTSGGTTALFFAALLVLFFGLFREEDHLSVDGFRRTANESLTDLREHLKSDRNGSHRLSALKWALLLVGIVYFGSGVAKLAQSGLGWATAENLSRIILVWNSFYDLPVDLGTVVLEYPLLVSVGAWGTLVLELGFLVAVVAGASVTPFVLGIMGMQLGIALLIGPFFFDVFPMFAMFLAWDVAHRRLATDQRLDVVFDERCVLCARSLYPVKFLDGRGSVTYYSQSDAPPGYADRPGVDFERSMYAFRDGEAFEGYDAFRELFRQFPATLPLSWVMNRRVVRPIGTRVYRHVAANRSRYFVCQIEAD